MHTTLLLLGGNLGDVKNSFCAAREVLRKHGTILAISKLYRSEAWGMEHAPEFLNQALIFKTDLKPEGVLEVTMAIEATLGRVRSGSSGYESRPLDIDILLVDQQVMESDKLTIPHARMHLRSFTLIPAAEIAGDWLHPLLNRDLHTLAIECQDGLKVEAV